MGDRQGFPIVLPGGTSVNRGNQTSSNLGNTHGSRYSGRVTKRSASGFPKRYVTGAKRTKMSVRMGSMLYSHVVYTGDSIMAARNDSDKLPDCFLPRRTFLKAAALATAVAHPAVILASESRPSIAWP